eukprot:scaffold23822_cov143-Skeletonema_marinoi.AAC.1
MTDDTIEKVLMCIVAVNNVKRLKLTNCFRITGAGLEPLRGSAIIEQIDLSIVGEHENPDIGQFPMILCDRVLPILDSIVEREGCALKHTQFPYLWRCVPSTESDFHAFCRRYNQMWRNREEIRCLGCNSRLPTGGNQWIETGTYRYGSQRHTCYDCLSTTVTAA